MPKDKLRKADVVTSLVLIALGVVVILYTTTMPQGGTFGGVINVWYVSPAVFPYLLGFLLICASTVILVRAIKEGGHVGIFGYYLKAVVALPKNPTVHRIWAIWIVVGVYIFGLFGRFNFYAVSAGFLVTFMLLFYRETDGRCSARTVVISLALGILFSVVTGFLFSRYLLVPLP